MKRETHYKWGRVINETEDGERLVCVIDSAGAIWWFWDGPGHFQYGDRVEIFLLPDGRNYSIVHRIPDLSTVKSRGGIGPFGREML